LGLFLDFRFGSPARFTAWLTAPSLPTGNALLRFLYAENAYHFMRERP
jgi:hypothetical protein